MQISKRISECAPDIRSAIAKSARCGSTGERGVSTRTLMLLDTRPEQSSSLMSVFEVLVVCW